jgi:hypothetical protein
LGRGGWSRAGLAKKRGSGLAQERNSTTFYLYEIFQNLLEWIQSKDSLSELENFQIKYDFEAFEIRNNFPYRKFLGFKTKFELKIREDSRVWNSIEFDWNY